MLWSNSKILGNHVVSPSICLYDATTAEKLEGTSRRVVVDPLPFLPLFVSFSRYCSTHVSHIPFPILFFLSPLKFSQEIWGSSASFPQCSAKNGSQLKKVRDDQIHPVPMISKVGRDASHRSRRVVALTVGCTAICRAWLNTSKYRMVHASPRLRGCARSVMHSTK